MFRSALVSVDSEALGPVAFARQVFNEGDTIPQGPGKTLRVVNVIEPDNEDDPNPPITMSAGQPRARSSSS